MSFIYQKPPNNYVYVVGQANIVDVRDDPVTQSGVVADQPLHTVTIPGNVFVQSQKAIVTSVGLLTAPVALIQVFARLNGSQIFATNSPINAVQAGFKIDIEIFRQGNNLLFYCSSQMNILISNSSFTNLAPNLSRQSISSFNFLNAITLDFRINTTNAGASLTQEMTWISVH